MFEQPQLANLPISAASLSSAQDKACSGMATQPGRGWMGGAGRGRDGATAAGDMALAGGHGSTARRGQAGSAAGLQEGNQSLVGTCLVGEQGFSSHLLGTEVSISPHIHFSIPQAPCLVPQRAAAHPLHPTSQGQSLHREVAQHPDPACLFPLACSKVPAIPWKPPSLLCSAPPRTA